MSRAKSTENSPARKVRWFAIVALIGHLLLLGSSCYSLWRISGGGWLGFGTALALLLCYLAMWRFWLAPGSRHRFAVRERLILKLILIPVLAIVTALGEVPVLGVVAGCFILLGDYLNERS